MIKLKSLLIESADSVDDVYKILDILNKIKYNRIIFRGEKDYSNDIKLVNTPTFRFPKDTPIIQDCLFEEYRKVYYEYFPSRRESIFGTHYKRTANGFGKAFILIPTEDILLYGYNEDSIDYMDSITLQSWSDFYLDKYFKTPDIINNLPVLCEFYTDMFNKIGDDIFSRRMPVRDIKKVKFIDSLFNKYLIDIRNEIQNINLESIKDNIGIDEFATVRRIKESFHHNINKYFEGAMRFKCKDAMTNCEEILINGCSVYLIDETVFYDTYKYNKNEEKWEINNNIENL